VVATDRLLDFKHDGPREQGRGQSSHRDKKKGPPSKDDGKGKGKPVHSTNTRGSGNQKALSKGLAKGGGPRVGESKAAQKKSNVCFVCGSGSHWARDCPERNRINSATQVPA